MIPITKYIVCSRLSPDLNGIYWLCSIFIFFTFIIDFSGFIFYNFVFPLWGFYRVSIFKNRIMVFICVIWKWVVYLSNLNSFIFLYCCLFFLYIIPITIYIVCSRLSPDFNGIYWLCSIFIYLTFIVNFSCFNFYKSMFPLWGFYGVNIFKTRIIVIICGIWKLIFYLSNLYSIICLNCCWYFLYMIPITVFFCSRLNLDLNGICWVYFVSTRAFFSILP